MRDYGIAVQYSIFACRLRRSDQAALEAKLLEILDAGVDQVMLIDLGPVKRTEDRVPGARVLGRARGGGIRGVVVV
jgi:CRISPR/Cas system-associated endoribonuclease Cas2